MGTREGGKPQARVVTIMRYTLRSDVPKKLNSDNQRDLVTENPLLQTLLCSSLVFSMILRFELSG